MPYLLHFLDSQNINKVLKFSLSRLSQSTTWTGLELALQCSFWCYNLPVIILYTKKENTRNGNYSTKAALGHQLIHQEILLMLISSKCNGRHANIPG